MNRCLNFHYKATTRALLWGFPAGSDSKESVCNAEDLGLITALGRSPGEGNDYALQYSFPREFHGQNPRYKEFPI